jgi:hypothetical protein
MARKLPFHTKVKSKACCTNFATRKSALETMNANEENMQKEAKLVINLHCIWLAQSEK